jgi:hypothetical protein
MRRDDIDLIASTVAALLRRSPRGRGARPQPRRTGRPRPTKDVRGNAGALASEIATLLGAPTRRPGQSGFSASVSAIASELIARLAPPERQQDLPMESIEI